MNLKIIFLFAVEIVPIILKIEHNDYLPLSPLACLSVSARDIYRYYVI